MEKHIFIKLIGRTPEVSLNLG